MRVAVVGHRLDADARPAAPASAARHRHAAPPRRSAARLADRRTDIGERQIERERAADAGLAAQLDLAAEQVRQLAADRQAEAGAAVFAAGAGVGLLERLEDDALLLRRDADAGVGDLERHHRRRVVEDRMIRRSSRRSTAAMLSCTPPCSVNLKAFDSRFFSTCCRRLQSVVMLRSVGSTCTSNDRPRLSASWRNGRVTVSCRLGSKISSASTDTVPDSIFDRSRMSLIRLSRSVPAPWMVRANSTWRGVRLPSGLSPSCWPRIRIEFSGVRSSCDMLARNSDLYFEVSASSAAFSSSARRACSISWFLRSTSTLCSASCCAFCSSCSLVCCNSRCWVCSSVASCCDCFSRPSVCIVASIEFSTMPMPAVSCSRNEICRSVNEPTERQLDHRLHLALEQHRQHDDVVRRRLEQAGADRHDVRPAGW